MQGRSYMGNLDIFMQTNSEETAHLHTQMVLEEVGWRGKH